MRYGEQQPQEMEHFDEQPEQHERRVNRYLLTIVQVCACVLALLAAIGLKLWGGPVYEGVRGWYTEHVNDTIVAQEDLNSIARVLMNLLPAPPGSSSGASSEASQSGASSQPTGSGAASTASSALPAESGAASAPESVGSTP